MKLAQSLVLYGLVDKPAGVGCDTLDYQDKALIDAADDACQARVAYLFVVLSRRILGESLAVDGPIVLGSSGYHDTETPKPASIGLRLDTFGRRQRYLWSNTQAYRQQYKWTCGWIESSWRRWLTGVRRELPVHLAALVPENLSGWAP